MIYIYIQYVYIYIWYALRNHLANPIAGCSNFRRLVNISSGLTRLWRSRAARIHFFNGVHVHHAAVGFITCRDFLIYGAKQKGKALWQTVWPSKHHSSLLPFLRGIWTWNIKNTYMKYIEIHTIKHRCLGIPGCQRVRGCQEIQVIWANPVWETHRSHGWAHNPHIEKTACNLFHQFI